jgi:glutamate formiminotransferase
MARKLVECIPNFSEGRREEVVNAIVEAISAVPGIHILDCQSDRPQPQRHHVRGAQCIVDAAFAGIGKAAELIDLDQHRGEHPRIGATDVVPFVPLSGVTMSDCVDLARTLGQRVGEELGIPVYLYEAAATRPDRQNLADIRQRIRGVEGKSGRS